MWADAASHATPGERMRRDPRLWAIVVTYRRPSVLARTLQILADQTRAPDSMLVVDNSEEADVQAAAEAAGVDYLAAPDNVGPAGAFTLGVASVLTQADPGDWVLFVDDDDPPTAADDLKRLLAFAVRESALDGRLAGVGFEGSRYDPARGTFRRLQEDELRRGPVDVDTLFGGSLPMYTVRALKVVGGPDPRFFWGFEEAELGLHLRSRGYRLVADGERCQQRRQARAVSGVSRPGRTPLDKAGWRRYYSVRNSTELAKRYARWYTVPYVAFGGAARGALALIRTRRPPREALLPIQGAVDGMTGRLGRRVDPGGNLKAGAGGRPRPRQRRTKS